MRKQLKLKGGGGGSELKLTLADVYGKKKRKESVRFTVPCTLLTRGAPMKLNGNSQ